MPLILKKGISHKPTPGPFIDVLYQNSIIVHLQQEAIRWEDATRDYDKGCIDREVFSYVRTLKEDYRHSSYIFYESLKNTRN